MWTTTTKVRLTVRNKNEPRNRFLKFVDISPTQHTPDSHDPLSHKTIAYSANALKAIRDTCQHDQRLKVLPFGAISRIKELKLNHKRRKNKQNIQIPFKQSGCNLNNVISIKKQGHKPDNNIIFGTCNVQSVRLKELQVSELISDYSLDFLLPHQNMA